MTDAASGAPGRRPLPTRRSANPARSLLRYLWALPASVVGFAVVVPALLGGATARRVGGVIEVGGGAIRRCVACLPRPMRFAAITLGHVIVGVDQATLQRVRAHEHVHVRQYERWGVLFFALYAGSSLVELLRGRRPYRDNCFEREAYRLAGDDGAAAADELLATHAPRASAARTPVA